MTPRQHLIEKNMTANYFVFTLFSSSTELEPYECLWKHSTCSLVDRNLRTKALSGLLADLGIEIEAQHKEYEGKS